MFSNIRFLINKIIKLRKGYYLSISSLSWSPLTVIALLYFLTGNVFQVSKTCAFIRHGGRSTKNAFLFV